MTTNTKTTSWNGWIITVTENYFGQWAYLMTKDSNCIEGIVNANSWAGAALKAVEREFPNEEI